ncbi:MAG: M15 family metallopeptidase [Candidatus Saganbacteria bacterium]|nr:M15 family metallopeptidase [Candidatus Saganbacteria bacterium]
MASRNPEDLSPAMQEKYSAWEMEMQNNGIDFILTCTRRSQTEQNALYLQGRGLPGKIVTWTLNSKHLTGDAFDFCIMNNGKCDWGMQLKDQWDKAIEIGKSIGLSQVVNSKGKVMEFAHLQIN